jgi:putative FmdB family regulatory protein
MPLYDTKCSNASCGHVATDVLLPSFSSPLPLCSLCSSSVERLVSNPGRAQFKGAGFHTTDYRSPTRGK